MNYHVDQTRPASVPQAVQNLVDGDGEGTGKVEYMSARHMAEWGYTLVFVHLRDVVTTRVHFADRKHFARTTLGVTETRGLIFDSFIDKIFVGSQH